MFCFFECISEVLMRLVILICPLLLSANGIANKLLSEGIKLTGKDIKNLCPGVERKTTHEAGMIAAKYFLKSYKGVLEHQL